MEKRKFRIRPQAPAGYMTAAQCAEYLGVSLRTVHRYITARGLPATKPAGRWIINREELEKWIRANG